MVKKMIKLLCMEKQKTSRFSSEQGGQEGGSKQGYMIIKSYEYDDVQTFSTPIR